MTCTNGVTFHVPRGFTTREVEVRCGLTDPWGGRTVCDTCAGDPSILREIEAHERGKAARRKGMKQGAVPPEYKAAQRLFDAWNDGWADADAEGGE